MKDTYANIIAKSKFYEENRDAIIKDLLSMGKTPARKKWGIPKGTIGALISRWLTPEQKAAIPPSPYITSITPSTDAESGDGRLPRFPEFSENWNPEVQVEWFRVYGKLVERGIEVI